MAKYLFRRRKASNWRTYAAVFFTLILLRLVLETAWGIYRKLSR